MRAIPYAAHREVRAPPRRSHDAPVLPLHVAVRGRARCRVQALYRAEGVSAAVEAELRRQPGIHSVSANVLTANILILFDPKRPVADIVATLARVLETAGGTHERRAATPTISGGVVPLRHRVAGGKDARHAWHALDGAAVLARVEGTWQGLSVEAAAERLRRLGSNLLPDAEPRSGLTIFLSQFASLPVALLGTSAAVSFLTGGLADAAVILGVVLINATIGYVTESQAERTINALTRTVEPNVRVRRAGAVVSLPLRQLVVGDLLALTPGTFIGADARLLEAQRLTIDESSLTGESLPVLKSNRLIEGADVPLADRVNMVYRGTRVSGGQGLAVVVATGAATEIGRIQRLMKEAEPPETPMERQLRRLGNQMVWVAGGVCGAVFVAGLLRGYGLAQMLKTSISLAVAAVPEGLPTVASTTLALGLRRMHRHKVLIRHLDAVETLGSVQVLCLDKTGTLTENRMAVVTLHVGGQRLAFRNGQFRRGGEPIDPYAADELLRLLHVAALCNETEINGERGGYVMNGSPTENALVHMALAAGVDVVTLRQRHPRLSVNYRAEHRRYMSTVHEAAPGSLLLAVKGGPAEVLKLSRWIIVAGERRLLSDAERELILAANDTMAGEALRVLGVAYATVDGPTPTSAEDGLTWLGLVGLADPVRAGVPELIGQFHRAGIETVMITGDQSATAYAIGRQLHLSGNDHLDILDSTHLETLDPELLKGLAGRVHVFTRVSPAHKLKIVQALQQSGKVVGMTGDGINDGPALRAADIGVAMGAAGTDVARQVADVVLEDDDLQTMIVAVSQGRTIYNNIRKSVHYLLATNLSEILVVFGAVTTGMGQPLNPMQLLWINLVTDIFPALGLALEPPEPDVLHRPPRDPGEPIVRSTDLKRIGFEAVTISAGTLGAYGYGLARYGAGPAAGTIAFASLTSAQLLHAISNRSVHHSVFDRGRLPANPPLYAALGGTAGLQLAALFVPGLRRFLGSTPLGPLDLAVAVAGAGVSFLVNETTKSLRRSQGGGP